MKKLQDLKGAGRPKAAIDLAEVEKLGVLHATDQEIADWFAVTRSTITRRKRRARSFVRRLSAAGVEAGSRCAAYNSKPRKTTIPPC